MWCPSQGSCEAHKAVFRLLWVWQMYTKRILGWPSGDLSWNHKSNIEKTFQDQSQVEHHLHSLLSPSCQHPINMIKQFPEDYMHQCCLWGHAQNYPFVAEGTMGRSDCHPGILSRSVFSLWSLEHDFQMCLQRNQEAWKLLTDGRPWNWDSLPSIQEKLCLRALFQSSSRALEHRALPGF